MSSPSKCNHEWLPLEQVCLLCGIPRVRLENLPPRPRLKIPRAELERSSRGGKVYFSKHRQHP